MHDSLIDAVDKESAEELTKAIGEYFDYFIGPEYLKQNSVNSLRVSYIEGVLDNPIALWCVAKWYFWPLPDSTKENV